MIFNDVAAGLASNSDANADRSVVSLDLDLERRQLGLALHDVVEEGAGDRALGHVPGEPLALRRLAGRGSQLQARHDPAVHSFSFIHGLFESPQMVAATAARARMKVRGK